MKRILPRLAKMLLGLVLFAVVTVSGLVTWKITRNFPEKNLPSAAAFRSQLSGPGHCQPTVAGTRHYAPWRRYRNWSAKARPRVLHEPPR
jgi:hypothetical protein